MVFDFAARPPEVNSTLIYSGAGAGPMMAAATSFSSLSSELATNAAAYESVISQLNPQDVVNQCEAGNSSLCSFIGRDSTGTVTRSAV